MHITLVDDSVSFDGYSPASKPLGGAEKAFASLPGALSRLGHSVHVINRCRWGMVVEGAEWSPLEGGKRPARTDVLIAFRKPSLLEFIRHAERRVLWFTAPGHLLERPATRQMLDSHKPFLLLTAEVQATGFNARGLKAGLLPAAVRGDFLNGEPRPHDPPRALVTTHPAHGLDWLLDLWIGRIRPRVPNAELHILSNLLAAAAEGAEVEETLRPLAAKVLAARDSHGVVITRPLGDFMMAVTYQESCVHLYPGHGDDMGCFTLMESQASGCPAVLRPLGAAPERVADGVSAYVAPDDDAFANLSVMLLSDAKIRAALGAEGRARYAGQTWDNAARVLAGWLSP